MFTYSWVCVCLRICTALRPVPADTVAREREVEQERDGPPAVSQSTAGLMELYGYAHDSEASTAYAHTVRLHEAVCVYGDDLKACTTDRASQTHTTSRASLQVVSLCATARTGQQQRAYSTAPPLGTMA